MKKTIKLISFIIVISLILSMVASCSKPSGDEESSSTDATASTTNKESSSPESNDNNTEPADTKPTGTDTEPSATKPIGTEPMGTEPSNTESSDTESIDTESIDTDPTVTESVATEPSTTEPIETEPQETDPMDDFVWADSKPLTGPYASSINLANNYANGVNVSYPSSRRDTILIQNKNSSLTYATHSFSDKLVASLKNSSGASYIENTMDVYVKMAGSDRKFYASKSSSPALMNIYRYGYYYYQVLIDNQDFTDTYNVEKELPLGLNTPDRTFYVKAATPSEEGAIAYTVIDTHDPQIQYTNSFTPFPTSEYNYIAATVKVSGNSTSIVSATAWIKAGSEVNFGAQSTSVRIAADGEYHTYYFRLEGVPDYTGNVSALRLDLDGLDGDTFEIKDIKAVKLNTDGAPLLGLNRIFNTYPDKMVQTLQVTAKADTTGIEEIGMVTKIAKNTVDKLIVKDANGIYTTLDSVDWSTAEYIAFDIKNVGIFGYILLADETSGKMEVTIEGENYVITQSRAPQSNMLKAPAKTDNKDIDNHVENYANCADFFMGQRIYTDENHDFTAFLNEAYCERNPLPAENITVDYGNSTKGAYVGYNALRGSYEFTLQSSAFGTAYYYEQNKHYGVKFTIKGDGYDRIIYIQSTLDDGQLECSAILDENNLLLPIPVEVCKNFSDGDQTIHWLIDDTYSETYFPITLSGDDEQTYNLLHLYQNWGRYPLKQISSIQFHCPYYHLSTGVTETNCIVNWYTTKSSRNIYSVLPDHRPMSAPLWAHEPQHTSGGSHGFLEYTDANGNHVCSENTKNVITSYGPTYAEIIMDYISDDGNIKVSYTHMEMPQTDENRTYYTMKYEVLNDVTIKDFRDNFTFYTVSPKPNLKYEWLSFNSERNRLSKVKTNTSSDKARKIVLGDENPFFAVYKATSDSSAKNDYVNLSFMVHSSEFVIGGEKVTPNFHLSDCNQEFKLSLDLGDVELKAGDTFTINAIIMPWGSQKSVYSVDDDPDFIPYQNVVDVIENSIKNPFSALAVKDCVIDTSSVFLPTVCTSNGKSAEFTLTGGANNCTVKLRGFTNNTIPTVYELNSDGEWVRYNLSSNYYPDKTGYTNTYDGYGVQYEENGLYAYSFVVKMFEGRDRTFKFVVDEEEYKNNPEIEPIGGGDNDDLPPAEIVEGYNRFFGAEDIKILADSGNMGKVEVKYESTEDSFVRFYGTGTNDPYFYLYSSVNEEDPLPTGQFFVFKYRLSPDNTDGNWMTIFSSTEKMTASTSTTIKYTDMIKDGEWHVVVINYALTQPSSFMKAKDGGYYATHLRFDVFGTSFPSTSYIDFQYMAFDDSFEEILAANMDVETVTYFDGDFYTVKTDGGELPEKIIIEDDTRTYDTPFSLYYSPRMLAHRMLNSGYGMKDQLIELVERPDNTFVTLWGNVEEAPNESYLRFYVDDKASVATGQYLVIKYKTTIDSYFEVYASTETVSPNNDERVGIDKKNKLFVNNGEWQIVILDLGTLLSKDSNPDDGISRGFNPTASGSYYAKVLRIDPFNSKADHETGLGVTFGFIGICDDASLEDAIKFDTSVDAVLFYNGTLTAYNPVDGSVIEDYQNPSVTPPVDPNPPVDPEPPQPDEEEETKPAEQVEGYNRYFDAELLTSKGSSGSGMGKVETLTENGITFTRFYGTGTEDPNFYIYRASQDTNTTPTGQYLVFKYRLAADNNDNNWIYFFSNTTTPNAANATSLMYTEMAKDGEWHIVVFDLSKTQATTYIKAENGGYYAKHLRIDIFGTSFPETSYIDVQFIAFDDSFEEILAANTDIEAVSYCDGDFYTIPTVGGSLPEKIEIEDDKTEYETPFDVYFSAQKLGYKMQNSSSGMNDSLVKYSEEDKTVTVFGNNIDSPTPGEAYVRFHVNGEGSAVTGQYLVIKYKTTSTYYMQLYASTETTSPNDGECVNFTGANGLLNSNGEWHIIMLDLSKLMKDSNTDDDISRGFKAADDGSYYAKVLRLDIFNSASAQQSGASVTFDYIGICGDATLTEAITYDSSVDSVIFYDGATTLYSTATGEAIAK